MKKFLVLSVICAILSWAVSAQAGGTPISSNITSNTTWDLSGSPYTITATITVASGVTLTIQPGVVVQMAGNYDLQVNGTLLADTVTFTSTKSVPAKNDWHSIKFTSSSGMSSSVTNSLIQGTNYGLYCVGASPTLRGNTVRTSTQGITVEGGASPLIQDNLITGNTQGIYANVTAAGAFFSSSVLGNTLTGNTSYGLHVNANNAALQSQPQVAGNSMAANGQAGIYYEGNVAGLINGGNTIVGNNTSSSFYYSGGIALSGDNIAGRVPLPAIHNNTIAGNGTATYPYNLWTYYYPTPLATVIQAQNNWWGTTDPMAIGQKIYDYSDNPSGSPVVQWEPYLNGPYPEGASVMWIYLDQPVPIAFTPGVDTVTFAAHVIEPSNWNVIINDSQNIPVRTMTASSVTSVSFNWMGYKDDGVTLVPQGWYSYEFSATSIVSSTVGVPRTGAILASAVTAPTLTLTAAYQPNATVIVGSGQYIFFDIPQTVKGTITAYLDNQSTPVYTQSYTTRTGSYAFTADTCPLTRGAHTFTAVASSAGYSTVRAASFPRVDSTPSLTLSAQTTPDSTMSLLLVGTVSYLDSLSSPKGSLTLSVQSPGTGPVACGRSYGYASLDNAFRHFCNLCPVGHGGYTITATAVSCGFTATATQGVQY